LPAQARGIADTDDLIQETIVRALGRLEHFEPKHAGSFPAYLRQILLNGVRDEIRKAKRRPDDNSLDEDLPDPYPTPFEQAVGRDVLERYECGLSKLPEDHQAAVSLRLELGLGYEEIGQLLEGRTANAARLLVVRALLRLAEEMSGE
jgi:RNA polymerase sigma-70 factor (ECF subfamily)